MNLYKRLSSHIGLLLVLFMMILLYISIWLLENIIRPYCTAIILYLSVTWAITDKYVLIIIIILYIVY